MKKGAFFLALALTAAVSSGTVFAGEFDRFERDMPGRTIQTPSQTPAQAPAPAPSPSGAFDSFPGEAPSRSPMHPAPRPMPWMAPPPPSHFNHGPIYFAIQLGMFEPNTDWLNGLGSYHTGFAFNTTIGARLSHYFAVEGSVGYFESSSNIMQGDIYVVPMTIGGRLIFPHPVVEPYIGGGFGIYFSDVNERRGVIGDSTDFGGYLSMGVDFWVTPRIAFNVDWRHHWVKPTIEGFSVDLSGWSMLFGARFMF